YVQTYACNSGNFASSSYPECFSEAWIRNGRRGAIAHVASSVTSYWTEDDTLERRVFDCMFDSAATWIMGGLNKAKLLYFRQMGSSPTTQRYLEMYNLMGDGAIDVFSQEPERLTVVHPSVIPLGVYSLLVSVSSRLGPVSNALV
ncbi:MAG: C25 family cysteine peptidase, partial [candidate division WOR-3 bacterium]